MSELIHTPMQFLSACKTMMQQHNWYFDPLLPNDQIQEVWLKFRLFYNYGEDCYIPYVNPLGTTAPQLPGIHLASSNEHTNLHAAVVAGTIAQNWVSKDNLISLEKIEYMQYSSKAMDIFISDASIYSDEGTYIQFLNNKCALLALKLVGLTDEAYAAIMDGSASAQVGFGDSSNPGVWGWNDYVYVKDIIPIVKYNGDYYMFASLTSINDTGNPRTVGLSIDFDGLTGLVYPELVIDIDVAIAKPPEVLNGTVAGRNVVGLLQPHVDINPFTEFTQRTIGFFTLCALPVGRSVTLNVQNFLNENVTIGPNLTLDAALFLMDLDALDQTFIDNFATRSFGTIASVQFNTTDQGLVYGRSIGLGYNETTMSLEGDDVGGLTGAKLITIVRNFEDELEIYATKLDGTVIAHVTQPIPTTNPAPADMKYLLVASHLVGAVTAGGVVLVDFTSQLPLAPTPPQDPLQVQNLNADRLGDSVIFNWDANNNYNTYSVENFNTVTGAVISKRALTNTTRYFFTAQEQVDVYGAAATAAHFIIRGINSDGVESTEFAEYNSPLAQG